MKRLSKKLHSQSGASILMALLMFLVCCMVAASVLAAAASNAGKVRSNRVEQQKYLTLSSAIQLVADEIQRAEYKGKYKVYEWTEVITTTVKDDEGNIVETTVESTDYFWCEQVNAERGEGKDYSCGDLTEQLPLEKELDDIFRKHFTEKGDGYKGLGETEVITTTVAHTLQVALPTGLEGYPYDSTTSLEAYKVPDIVTVQVKLDHNTHHITLNAWFGDDPKPPGERTPPLDNSNTMIAELVVQEGTAPVLNYNPEGRTAGTGPWESSVVLSPGPGETKEKKIIDSSGATINTSAEPTPVPTNPATEWELHWIKKGVVS